MKTLFLIFNSLFICLVVHSQEENDNCKPGNVECDKHIIYTCNDNKNWEITENCLEQGKMCGGDGTCIECPEGEHTTAESAKPLEPDEQVKDIICNNDSEQWYIIEIPQNATAYIKLVDGHPLVYSNLYNSSVSKVLAQENEMGYLEYSNTESTQKFYLKVYSAKTQYLYNNYHIHFTINQ
jgi:hypothetical protein